MKMTAHETAVSPTPGRFLRAGSEEGNHPYRASPHFRNFISPEPGARFPPESGRYALYVHPGCPWAHRANLVRSLKGLEDVIQLIVLDSMDPIKGWFFSGTRAGPERDPLYGYKYLRDLYIRADPFYSGRITVPTLWDKTQHTIVSNECSEICRMMYESFDQFVPEPLRESSKGMASLLPSHLHADIDTMNEWVYAAVNNGVYKIGFATSQETYEQHLYQLFGALDRLEAHLSMPGHAPYLFGEHITEADLRLYPTLVRFDAAYYTIFKCNLKMIRHDYPRLHEWLRRLYWHDSPAFRLTTRFDLIKSGYSKAMKSAIVPAGPYPDILPLEGETATVMDESREHMQWLKIWG